MTFPIDITVPNINNDPADDVAPMNQNFINTKGYLSVDHVTPGAPGAGFHSQVTYNALTSPAAPAGPPYGIAYTKAGQTTPSVGENYYINQTSFFPMSAIRVLCNFTTTNANPVQINQSVNVVSGNRVSAGNYTFTLTTGVIKSAHPLIFTGLPIFGGISIAGDTVTITGIQTTAGVDINFMILEL